MTNEAHPDDRALDDSFLKALEGLPRRVADCICLIRHDILDWHSPIYEFLQCDGTRVAITYSITGRFEDVICRLVSCPDGVEVSFENIAGHSECLTLEELGQSDRWSLCSKIAANVVKYRPRFYGTTRTVRRRPRGVRTLAHGGHPEDTIPPGATRVLQPFRRQFKCHLCQATVPEERWWRHFEEVHGDDFEPRSVWTISGGGGPGTGKRR